jgi:ATP-dependent protease Clp ATPase subunit
MFGRRKLRCSFCGKTEAQVAKLVAGPRVFICDECVAIASAIMKQEAATHAQAAQIKSGVFRRLWGRVAGRVNKK